jgi:hypothetical protein
MEIGLGVPRETLRLVHDGNASHEARLVTNKSGIDLTEKMNAYAGFSGRPAKLCRFAQSSNHDAHTMGEAVVGQGNGRGARQERLAVELKVSHAAAGAMRIVDRDLIARRVVSEGELVTSPATRYAGIEE